MDQSLKEKTLDNLTKAQSILIMVSQNSGTDGLASGLSLYLSLLKAGKNVSIMAKAPSVGDAQKLYGVDKIGEFKGNKNLVVVINNAVETIDRVSHFLDGDKLKLILHVFPQSSGISQNQISFEEEGIKPDVLFSIGYSSEGELKTEIEHVQNIDSTSWVVNISLNDLGQILAQVNIFNEKAASLSEITGDFINQFSLPIDEDIAYNLYTGISEATMMFSPGRTSPLSLEMAAWLLKFGAGRASFAQSRPASPAIAPQPAVAQENQIQSNPSVPQPIPQPVSMPTTQTPPVATQPASIEPMIEEGPPIPAEESQAPLEEPQPLQSKSDKSWLNPPKIYKGSQSFDTKS